MPEPMDYGSYWDKYVKNHPPREDYWPGDEWGSTITKQNTYVDLIESRLDNPNKFVEIGPGAGKYTLMTLEKYPDAHILAADVSAEFLEVLTLRINKQGYGDRLHTCLLDDNSDTLNNAIDELGWSNQVDCFYSIDALVHVPIQDQIVYWQTAKKHLKSGGKLSMTLANGASPAGVSKMLKDAIWAYGAKGRPSGSYAWTSIAIIEALAKALELYVVSITPHGTISRMVAMNDPNGIEKPQIPLKSYTIIAPGRSGSTWLCELLSQLEVLGMPGEYLNPPVRKQYGCEALDDHSYLAHIPTINQRTHLAFGIKSTIKHWKPFYENVKTSPYLNKCKYISLTREDIWSQAVSLYVSQSTQVWQKRDDLPMPPVEFNAHSIYLCAKAIHKEMIETEEWFSSHNITPYRLTYERLYAHPYEVIREICDHLEISCEIPKLDMDTMKIMRNEQSISWVNQMKGMESWIKERDRSGPA